MPERRHSSSAPPRFERRTLTEFCLTALGEAARHVISRQDTLVLSDGDRAAFFDALVRPQRVKARLRRAFRAERTLIQTK